MAINPLNIAESLRPWRTAGISLFLTEVLGQDEAAYFLDETEGMAAPVSLPPNLQSECIKSPLAASPPGNTFVASPDVFPPDATTQEQIQSVTPPVSGASSYQPKVHAQATVDSPVVAPSFIPVEHWPEGWRSLYARMRPTPIVWTYLELGDDLTGNGDKQRSQQLKTLIGNLHLPKGSSGFWPVRLHGTQSLEEAQIDAQIFISGLQLLHPQLVVIMGSDTLTSIPIDLELKTPFTQRISQGVLYVLLPHFFELQEKPNLGDRCGIFLRSALSAFPGIFTTK